MLKEILQYHESFEEAEQALCMLLAETIDKALPEASCKLWHAHPVWFLEGNPIVGYSKQKKGIRLMFWSGADFGEEKLNVLGGKFKDASIFYKHESDIEIDEVKRWLQKAKEIQWDYKNIVKRKGQLVKLG